MNPTETEYLNALKKHIRVGFLDFDNLAYLQLMEVLCLHINQGENEQVNLAFSIAFDVLGPIHEKSKLSSNTTNIAQINAAICCLSKLTFPNPSAASNTMKMMLNNRLFKQYRSNLNRLTMIKIAENIDLIICNVCSYLHNHPDYVEIIVKILKETLKLPLEQEQRWFIMLAIRKIYPKVHLSHLLEFYTNFENPPRELMELIAKKSAQRTKVSFLVKLIKSIKVVF
jgi:hypothetical protein